MSRWPGRDGLLVLGCAAVVAAFAVARGVPGVWHWVALVLLLDAVYLTATWWSRR